MEAMTPSFLKRGMSAGSTTWACSMRLRAVRETPGCENASRAMAAALSPMAWKPSWKPAVARSTAILLSCVLRVLRQAGVAGIVGEGRFHRRGARAERAIHEALEQAGVQHGIVGVVVGAHLLQFGRAGR